MNRSEPELRIQLLGAFSVQLDGVVNQGAPWRLRKAKVLLAMLALAPGQRRHREQILDRLWPDLDVTAAARNLHQTLYVARHSLAGLGVPTDGLMTVRDEQVVLDAAGPVRVDVLDFEEMASQALRAADETSLRAAADLYGGDLLPDLGDTDWLATRRDEVRRTQREVLVKLATAVRLRSPAEALMLLNRVLESDPVHEGAVRALMLVLADLGRRSEALARYERLVEDLLDAYGTDPDAQTVAVFRELLTGAPAQRGSPQPAGAQDLRTEIGYLPVPVTRLIGRERELLDVERLLDRARLLTLTGAGGSGKTRLALAAARRVRADYPDGVWFVDLAAVGESLRVPDAVTESLGLDAGPSLSRSQALVDQLRHRSLLIVLDNCEHLLAACAQLVAVLLAGCPNVDVLATSREPLHTHGEYTFRVPSLALPSPLGPDTPNVSELAELPSVRLFVERAAQVRPGFTLDADNAPGVVDLCRRLDGIPLALELAAARTAILEPAEIVQRLGDALSMLGGGQTGVTRHQTLRATLAWSYDLLTEPEKVLLRRLSVFAGGFTLVAVEEVCSQPPLAAGAQLELLATLVDKSLVVTEKTPSGTRYRQLETVRQFGREKLDQAAESALLLTAHCAYFLAFAVTHNPERATGVVIEQPKVLDSEHDNLRAALQWSCAHEPETALRLAASLWRFWFLRGHAVEGARWVERALAVSPDASRPRAAALIGLTGLDSRQGRGDRHRALGAEALAITRQIGAPDEVVMARLVQTALVWSLFELDEAERLATELHTEAIERGRAEHAAAASWLLGQCALSREDGPLATREFERSLRELTGSDVRAAPFLPAITPGLQLVLVDGRLVPYVEETLLLGRRVGVAQAQGYATSAIGYAGRLSADLESARSAVEDALAQFTELGDDLASAQALHQLGCIQRDGGDYDHAGTALSVARDIRRRLGDRRGELLTEINLALVHAMAGEVDHGLAAARGCLSGFESAGDQVGMGATLTILGAIELVRGEVRAAREMYSGAADRLAPWPRHTGWQRLLSAELSMELGDKRRSERELQRAAAIFDRTTCLIAGRRLAELRGFAQVGPRRV